MESLKLNNKTISVWGFSLPINELSQFELDYLSKLPADLPPVEWVWCEMNRIWTHFSLDNRKPLLGQPIGNFYHHPVWLMNGVFTATDSVSISHRVAIARYIGGTKAKSVADYGGGFGELARTLICVIDDVKVSIVEPYPSRVALNQLRDKPNVFFVSDLPCSSYDVVIMQDVLEHIEDPIGLAYEVSCAVKLGGLVIFANCFSPVILCHLPSTFYLRHTFIFVMKFLGLKYVGKVEGADHALVFKRQGCLRLKNARRAAVLLRPIGSLYNRIDQLRDCINRMVNCK